MTTASPRDIFQYPQDTVAHMDGDWMFYSDGRWHHLSAPYNHWKKTYTAQHYTPRTPGTHKVHVSIPHTHAPQAWNCLVTLLMENRLRAKIGTHDTLKKLDTPTPSGERHRQQGKMITIYIDSMEDGPDTHPHWMDLFDAIEDRLQAAGIPPSSRPHENHALAKHGYLSFRAAYDAQDAARIYQRANLARPHDFDRQ